MPMIMVPTGVTNYETTCTRKSLLMFSCESCGQTNVQEKIISGKGYAAYHFLQGKSTKERKMLAAREKALKMVDDNDQKMFHGINEIYDYSCIDTPVMCSHCGKKQKWSSIPSKWSKKKFFPLWIIFAFFCGITIATIIVQILMGNTPFGMLNTAAILALCVLTAVAVFFPIRNAQKRKKIMEELKDTPFPRPVYINKQNVSEYADKLHVSQ